MKKILLLAIALMILCLPVLGQYTEIYNKTITSSTQTSTSILFTGSNTSGGPAFTFSTPYIQNFTGTTYLGFAQRGTYSPYIAAKDESITIRSGSGTGPIVASGTLVYNPNGIYKFQFLTTPWDTGSLTNDQQLYINGSIIFSNVSYSVSSTSGTSIYMRASNGNSIMAYGDYTTYSRVYNFSNSYHIYNDNFGLRYISLTRGNNLSLFQVYDNTGIIIANQSNIDIPISSVSLSNLIINITSIFDNKTYSTKYPTEITLPFTLNCNNNLVQYGDYVTCNLVDTYTNSVKDTSEILWERDYNYSPGTPPIQSEFSNIFMPYNSTLDYTFERLNGAKSNSFVFIDNDSVNVTENFVKEATLHNITRNMTVTAKIYDNSYNLIQILNYDIGVVNAQKYVYLNLQAKDSSDDSVVKDIVIHVYDKSLKTNTTYYQEDTTLNIPLTQYRDYSIFVSKTNYNTLKEDITTGTDTIILNVWLTKTSVSSAGTGVFNFLTFDKDDNLITDKVYVKIENSSYNQTKTGYDGQIIQFTSLPTGIEYHYTVSSTGYQAVSDYVTTEDGVITIRSYLASTIVTVNATPTTEAANNTFVWFLQQQMKNQGIEGTFNQNIAIACLIMGALGLLFGRLSKSFIGAIIGVIIGFFGCVAVGIIPIWLFIVIFVCVVAVLVVYFVGKST